MPSINLNKLSRLLEAARAASLHTQDLSSRIREARSTEAHCRSTIENQLFGRGWAVPDEVSDLLALPPDEAKKVGRATLIAHRINPETFFELIAARAARLRMEAALGEAQARSEGLNAPFEELPYWLASHGFPNYVREFS